MSLRGHLQKHNAIHSKSNWILLNMVQKLITKVKHSKHLEFINDILFFIEKWDTDIFLGSEI